MTDVGVDDKFIKEIGENIEPGHSALFLLVIDSTPDKVMEGLQGLSTRPLSPQRMTPNYAPPLVRKTSPISS
jgi:uncharacterized membrane protein